MLTRRRFLKFGLAAGAAAVLSARDREALRALADSPADSPQGPALAGARLSQSGFTIRAAPYPNWPLQTQLDSTTIPQFVDKLPDLKFITAGTGQIELQMREFKFNMLPPNFTLPGGQAYAGTWLWGYRTPDQPDNDPNAFSYLGPVIVATRGTPTEIKFVNMLGTGASTNVRAFKYSIDQTLHWAFPTGMVTDADGYMCHALPAGTLPSGDCAANYTGPIPAVPHLHGGEVPALTDGGPDAWFTSDGQYHGKTFYSKDGSSSNYCIYRYPNKQEAALIWFHDHTLGATRVNVFCGLAGAYLLTDPNLKLPAGLSTMPTVPMVIQDRSFDTDGQILLPAGAPDNPNPDHPYWVPEFVGDVICVNGKTWPYLEVEPRRYRFLIINGSNARSYSMALVNTNTGGKTPLPTMWQIGTDGGYLDNAVPIDPRRFDVSLRAAGGTDNGTQSVAKGGVGRLVMMPGERADIIIDFTGLKGQTFILENIAAAPLPSGDPVDPATTGRVIMFRVNKPLSGKDTSYNPAADRAIRKAEQRIVRLTTQPNLIRQLTLNEIANDPVTAVDPVTGQMRDYEGGPVEILVNNTGWSGRLHNPMPGMPMEEIVRPDFTPDKVADLSEIPQEGTVEMWEIVNLTMDAHPIHTHLTQFQLLGRQSFDMDAYMQTYEAAFPGCDKVNPATGEPYEPGEFIPAFGPPLDYNTLQPLNLSAKAVSGAPVTAKKVGGNPDVGPFLNGPQQQPNANEYGWKDTIQCPPNMVTRFMVRFAPTDVPLNTPGAYPFDPGNEGGQGSDYVWHCHIVDHEDNEMMRPYTVKPKGGASRTWVKGKDF